MMKVLINIRTNLDLMSKEYLFHATYVIEHLKIVQFFFDWCAKTDYIRKDGMNIDVINTAVH